MRFFRNIVFSALLAFVPFMIANPARAQIVIGIGIGPVVAYPAPVYVAAPPTCEWGYYGYYPYACAPYGYYGADWFMRGIFIGAGPWFRGGYGHPWGWGWGHIGYYGYSRFGFGGGYPYNVYPRFRRRVEDYPYNSRRVYRGDRGYPYNVRNGAARGFHIVRNYQGREVRSMVRSALHNARFVNAQPHSVFHTVRAAPARTFGGSAFGGGGFRRR